MQRVCVLPDEGSGIALGIAVDTALRAMALPDQIGFHANDRIAPANFASCDRFQQKRVFLILGEFQHQADGGVQIGGEARIDDLVAPGGIGGAEVVKGGGQLHAGSLVTEAWVSGSWRAPHRGRADPAAQRIVSARIGCRTPAHPLQEW